MYFSAGVAESADRACVATSACTQTTRAELLKVAPTGGSTVNCVGTETSSGTVTNYVGRRLLTCYSCKGSLRDGCAMDQSLEFSPVTGSPLAPASHACLECWTRVSYVNGKLDYRNTAVERSCSSATNAVPTATYANGNGTKVTKCSTVFCNGMTMLRKYRCGCRCGFCTSACHSFSPATYQGAAQEVGRYRGARYTSIS